MPAVLGFYIQNHDAFNFAHYRLFFGVQAIAVSLLEDLPCSLETRVV